LGGPAFELKEFLDFIEFENWYPKDKETPSSIWPALVRFGQSMFALALYLGLSKICSLHFAYTDEFDQLPFLYKWLYIYIISVEWRAQYYFAWVLSESSNILSGFGFNGYDEKGNVKWDRVINVEMLKVEFCENPRALTLYWNMTAGKWLRNHFYLRVVNKDGLAPASGLYGVMIFSAFWHGFYPGYYMLFVTCAMGIHCGRIMRRHVRPLLVIVNPITKEETPIQPWKKIYDILGTVCTSLVWDMTVPAFNGLSFGNGWRVFKSVYFSGHILLLLAYLFMELIFPIFFPKKKKNDKNDNKED